MAEAAAAKLAEEVVGCVNQIKHQFSYLTHYHENIVNLHTKLKNLESKRTEVQDKVHSATDKGETIISGVDEWLGEVSGEMEEAEKILKDKDRVGNGCWKGWFVNLNLRYSLSKKAMVKSGDLVTFLARGVFDNVSHPKRPLAYVYDPTGAGPSEIKPTISEEKNNVNNSMKKNIGDHQVLEVEGSEEFKDGATSTTSTARTDGSIESRLILLNKVMEAVRDPEIRMIRICGMGGVGKTTIAKQVEHMARAERLFHEIVMTEVNQKPDLKILQLHIAELLGLELEEDSIPARAKRLCDRLIGKDQGGEGGENKKILLILDNVWKKEDLEEAGIPLTYYVSPCKILMTSRSDRVCKHIAPEFEFNVEVLSREEALILFRQCIPNKAFYDQGIAEDLVKECGGLPISVTIIAKALANKTKVEWKVTLRNLQKSIFTGEYAGVLNCLKISYDFLEDDKIKKFFRLFCLFPKGSGVPIEDLVRYGMAFRFFNDPDKLYEARDEARSYAEMLLHSSLLLCGDKAGCYKVHDHVWDFVLSASSDELYMVNHGDALTEWPRIDSNEKYISISLQCSELDEVPEGLDYPNLKLLHLTGNSGTRQLNFPETFFGGTCKLNVLAFTSINVPSFPRSLELLRNLRSLSFHRCSMGNDISMIGNMGNLEILSFAQSNVQELPIQIARLRRLRLLDVTGCNKLHVIAPHVLSKLSSLEELYMRGTPLRTGNRSQAMFSEIASMSKLVVMDIEMPVEALPMDSLFAKLKNFKISVTTSERVDKDEYSLFENYLDLKCDSRVLQQHGVRLLLLEAVRMYLEISDLKTLLPLNESKVINFSNLKSLSMHRCSELVYLVNMMGDLHQVNFFEDLVSLHLTSLPCMVDIFHVQSSSDSIVSPFRNLKVLQVLECNALENIFTLSTAKSLNMLERFEVASCIKLKSVFKKERDGEDKVELHNLKYVTLNNLPNLVGFGVVDVIEFPQLENLNLQYLPSITSIIHPEIEI